MKFRFNAYSSVTYFGHVQDHLGIGGLLRNVSLLRWLNTVFDTGVLFTFFSKTFDPLLAKNGSKQIDSTNFDFFDS